jgi:hypothetical protein
VETVHNRILVQKVINGEEELNLNNLNMVFPNNVLSLVPSDTVFSGITDNALAGKVEVNEKLEAVGGNEDFLYGFEEMIYNKKDCVLLIEPFVAGERQGEIMGIESKYARRQIIYKLYAERTIRQAVKRGKIDLGGETENELTTTQIENIIQNTVDEHLFFARINQNDQPEIILTRRQELKSISSPFKQKLQ